MGIKQFALSDFYTFEIIRSDVAEVIVDYFEGKPIRLIGFSTDIDKKDSDIAEEAFSYYKRLFDLTHEN